MATLFPPGSLIAACDGLLGLALAWRGSELLLRLATSNTGPIPINVAPDARIIAFTCIALNHLGTAYFSTMGIPLVAGRDFDARDGPETPKVAIVSEKRARHFAGNPVGQRLATGSTTTYEIVGVAKDTRYANVKDQPRDVVYLPMSQDTTIGFPLSFEIRYEGTSAEMLRLATAAVNRIDPALIVFRARTLETQTQQSFARERLLALLTTYFGAFALLLAGVGLYGLVTCTVTQRTRELGLRIALGARPSGIRWMVMREGAATIVVGLAVGLAAAFTVVRLARTRLFEVEPADPLRRE